MSDDPLDCFSYLMGLFSALTARQRGAWLEDASRPSLLFRGSASIVPAAGESPLPSRFRRVLPMTLDTADLWEVRRIRPGAPPSQTFVEGSVLRECMTRLGFTRDRY